jgi:hypothetical protein
MSEQLSPYLKSEAKRMYDEKKYLDQRFNDYTKSHNVTSETKKKVEALLDKAEQGDYPLKLKVKIADPVFATVIKNRISKLPDARENYKQTLEQLREHASRLLAEEALKLSRNRKDYHFNEEHAKDHLDMLFDEYVGTARAEMEAAGIPYDGTENYADYGFSDQTVENLESEFLAELSQYSSRKYGDKYSNEVKIGILEQVKARKQLVKSIVEVLGSSLDELTQDQRIAIINAAEVYADSQYGDELEEAWYDYCIERGSHYEDEKEEDLEERRREREIPTF